MATVTPAFRQSFETWAANGQPPLQGNLPVAAAALMAHAAFVEPERQIAIFDAIAEAWLDLNSESERIGVLQSRLPFLLSGRAKPTTDTWTTPRAIWDAFWAVVEIDPAQQPVDPNSDAQALDLTTRVVMIGLHYDLELLQRCERAVLMHPDVHTLLAEPEVRMTTNDLRNRPQDSLGTHLLDMLTANGYDLEVIDADSILLPPVFPAQNRTNRRILQLHDVWHLVAEYGFTVQGETAISGFQLAQFGQNYSTRYLAVVSTIMTLSKLVDPDQFVTMIAEGWRHGRQSGGLMSVPWHKLLNQPIPKLRHDLSVEPFRSRTPEFLNFDAKLLNQMMVTLPDGTITLAGSAAA